MKYLLDLKNIRDVSGIDRILSDWSVTKLSERTFEISGRPYTGGDLMQINHCLGNNGHIFIFDYEDDSEYYRPKKRANRRQYEARDSDLDEKTLHQILAFRDAQP